MTVSIELGSIYKFKELFYVVVNRSMLGIRIHKLSFILLITN
jgi:hypothetical protein